MLLRPIVEQVLGSGGVLDAEGAEEGPSEKFQNIHHLKVQLQAFKSQDGWVGGALAGELIGSQPAAKRNDGCSIQSIGTA